VRLPAALLLLLALSVPAHAQPPTPDVSARLKELAASYNSRDRQETIRLVEPILALPDLTRADRLEALRIKANAEVAVGTNDTAVATLRSALDLLDPSQQTMRARLLLTLANAYRGQKKRELALAESRAAQAIIEPLGDDELLLECLTAQLHYIDESDEPVWRPVARRAMELAERRMDRGAKGRIHHIIADRAFTTGEYATAVRELELAVTNLRAASPAEPIALARALTSLGRARRAHGLPQRALDAYREAMAVQQRIGDRFGVVQSWNAMGVAWSHLDRHDKSLECYRLGLAEAESLGDQSAVQFMQGAVATAQFRLGKPNEAIPIFERLLARNPDPYIARFRLATLADAYLEVGRPADALATVDKALAMDQSSHPDAVATFQFTRARANAAMGRHDVAIADARRALDTYERIRQSLLPLDFVKRGYSDQIQGVFDFTVGALDEAGRHGEAVEAAEAARGRALADLLASRMADTGSEAAARMSNSDAATLLTGAPTGADAAPPGLDSPVATRALSSAELAGLARQHRSTILSYWVGADRSLVWVIRGDGEIVSSSLAVTRARLQQLVDQASRPPVIAVDGGAHKADAAEVAMRRLHDILIGPIEALLPAAGSRLTVVPHGPLFSLAFAALQNSRGRYLIERYAIHDVPSGAVLALGASRLPATTSRWVLVADPAPRPRGAASLPPLPAAAREIAAAAAAAPTGAATRLIGSKASERAFRSALADARVIHIAAHAVVPEQDPAGAFLALGRETAAGDAAARDGRLTAAEIYDLRVGADLVVLSACRSGRGRITGDGVAGFTRAFISAGARTVVASLWDAPDESARRLMAGFYRHLAAGMDKADALRAAQRALLADLRAGRVTVSSAAGEIVLPPHPAIWAGFRVHGLP
jgi:CHAT domain-containing protein/tetratricopeptide (TPR) repeat protein